MEIIDLAAFVEHGADVANGFMCAFDFFFFANECLSVLSPVLY